MSIMAQFRFGSNVRFVVAAVNANLVLELVMVQCLMVVVFRAVIPENARFVRVMVGIMRCEPISLHRFIGE